MDCPDLDESTSLAQRIADLLRARAGPGLDGKDSRPEPLNGVIEISPVNMASGPMDSRRIPEILGCLSSTGNFALFPDHRRPAEPRLLLEPIRKDAFSGLLTQIRSISAQAR